VTKTIHNCACCRCACETIEQVRALQELREEPLPYAPDWIVQRIVDRGPGEKFRWYVVGINTNHEPGNPDRAFRWSVPEPLCWRYDLSAAQLVTAEAALRHRVTEPLYISGYYTVLVPFSERPTQWHPTTSTGPFAVLTRGAFRTRAEAVAWADDKLCAQPYELLFIEGAAPLAGLALLCQREGSYHVASLAAGPAAVLARLLDVLRQLAPEAVAGLPGISPDALADDAHPAWNGGPAEAALHAIMATVNAHAPEGFALIIEGDSLGFHPLAGEGI
jgi:hypothetical protein